MSPVSTIFMQALGEYAGTTGGSAGVDLSAFRLSDQLREISTTTWFIVAGVVVGVYLFTKLA